MSRARKLAKSRRSAKIYFGRNLYWTVKVSDARQPVVIKGTVADALRGTPGETIGCHLSNCALRNSKAFPHPVELVAFTKTAAYAVDRFSNGQAVHAVRYKHDYKDWVELNDKDKGKTVIREHPEWAEREFVLKVPRRHPSMAGSGRRGTDRDTGTRKPYVPKGALARAQAAGLVTASLGRAMKR